MKKKTKKGKPAPTSTWCFPGNVHIIFMCTANGCNKTMPIGLFCICASRLEQFAFRFKKLNVNHCAALNLAAAVIRWSTRYFATSLLPAGVLRPYRPTYSLCFVISVNTTTSDR